MLTIENLVITFPEEKQSRKDKNAKNVPKDDRHAARAHAVDGISIQVEEGEFYTLLGPSGCGKTTTLRAVAGLEVPESGSIAVAGRILFEAAGPAQKKVNVPANKRGLGMVFQSYAIWPHLSVFENAAFPLKVAGAIKDQRKDVKARVMKVLETMELAHLADRRATKLSGGQQQRLALARAIVTEPPLLLLDEPLSNLDAKLRESLRFEIKRLQHELGITTLYVTHDQNEALAMSSQIAVMNAGRIVQLGDPRAIYESPNSTFVAEFIGASNLVRGTVSKATADSLEVDTAIGAFRSSRVAGLSKGDAVRVSVRPEAFELAEKTEAVAANRLPGRVITSSYVGDSVITVVDIGGTPFRVRSKPTLNPAPETAVTLTVAPAEVGVLLDAH